MIILTLFDTFSCKLLFIVHCYVIVANAVSGCYFPLVSCNTRVKHMAFGMFHGRSLRVVITLLDVYSQEYRIELKFFVVYLIVRNYDSVFATKTEFHKLNISDELFAGVDCSINTSKSLNLLLFLATTTSPS